MELEPGFTCCTTPYITIMQLDLGPPCDEQWCHRVMFTPVWGENSVSIRVQPWYKPNSLLTSVIGLLRGPILALVHLILYTLCHHHWLVLSPLPLLPSPLIPWPHKEPRSFPFCPTANICQHQDWESCRLSPTDFVLLLQALIFGN